MAEILTRDRVTIMINQALKQYDEVQERRHNENLAKLEPIIEFINQHKGKSDIVRWIIPIVISVVLLLQEFFKK